MLASTSARRGPIIRRSAAVVAAENAFLLDCGDGVRLQCFHSSPEHSTGRLAVLLHGWEGSAQSLYVLSLAQLLFERGFEVVRLNLRDHGDTHHLNRELFHSCRLPEVVGAIGNIQRIFPGKPLNLVGFSLGGNFVLRVAAQAGEANLDIARAIAVSPVLDPGATLIALEQGMPGYQLYFVRKWMRSLLKKQAVWPADYDFREIGRLASLRRMTAELILRFTESPSLDDYLNGYSITDGRLARLEVPATIITSLDDPIIPAHSLERLTGPSWVERRIVAELDAEQEAGEVRTALTSA